MANNHDKLWAQKRSNQAAIQRAKEVLLQTGRALPCVVTAVSGKIVTVKFQLDTYPWTLPQITIPKLESKWISHPTQIGDTGITVPADAHIGIISGLGSNLGNIGVKPANLSALVFVPVSNSSTPAGDPNAAMVQGPNGAVIQTEDGSSSVVVNSTGITMTFGSKVVTLNASGFTIDGILFDTHVHSGVQTGGSNTGGPV